MNQETSPQRLVADLQPATQPGADQAAQIPPLSLRRDLVAMLPYLNRSEFCRRSGWDQAREVDCRVSRVIRANSGHR